LKLPVLFEVSVRQPNAEFPAPVLLFKRALSP